MTQKTITEEQLNEVVKDIVRHPGIINLDADDVRYVLSGKSGILYSAQQEVSDYFNWKNGVPVGEEYIKKVQEYELTTTSKRK